MCSRSRVFLFFLKSLSGLVASQVSASRSICHILSSSANITKVPFPTATYFGWPSLALTESTSARMSYVVSMDVFVGCGFKCLG